MDTRVKELIEALENRGWQMVEDVQSPFDWWSESVVKLVSKWNPVGTKIYLTTLVDPQWGTTELDYRKRNQKRIEKKVWAIGISRRIPSHRLAKFEFHVSLNELSEPKIKWLTEQVEDLRAKTS